MGFLAGSLFPGSLGLPVDILVVELGIHDLLAAVKAVIARESVAKRDCQQVVWHSFKSKELKADKQ